MQSKLSVKKKEVDPMVSPTDVQRNHSFSTGTLANWRSKKIGPPYFKVGRCVRYRLSDLERFFASNPVLTKESVIDES